MASPSGNGQPRAVVFDLGGVLLDWNPRHLYRELFDAEAEMERFLSEVCTMEWHHAHDLGVPPEETIPPLVEAHPEYAEMVKGRFAQITNRTERREASAITAAEFLHHFAGEVPWAHLDIAGVGDHGRAPYLDKGGTGFGVRLLTELALSF